MKKPYRRRLIVDKFNRFTTLNLNYLLFVLLIFGVALFAPLIIQMEFGAYSQFEREQAASQLVFLHRLVWPPILITLLLLFLGSLLFTHRIAGPLYRLRCVLKQIGEGDLSGRATLRKHDYLHSEAKVVNEMIDSLRGKVRDVEAEYRQVEEALRELTGAIDTSPGKAYMPCLERLEAYMQRVRATLDQFKTGS